MLLDPTFKLLNRTSWMLELVIYLALPSVLMKSQQSAGGGESG
jgi:hypothetical protein